MYNLGGLVDVFAAGVDLFVGVNNLDLYLRRRGGERVRFNLIRRENRLLGSVVTTDGTADLTNDLSHVGSMAPCSTLD